MVRAGSPRPALAGLLPWLLAGGLLAFLFWRVPLDDAARALGGARLGLFLPGTLVASLIFFCLDSAVLARLVSGVSVPLSGREARALRGVSYLATPIHWHAGKAAIVARLRRTKQVPILESTSALLLVQLLDALILSALALLGLQRMPEDPALAGLRGLALAVFVLALGYLALIRSDRLGLPVIRRLRQSALHRAHRRLRASDLATLLVLKTAYHGSFVLCYLLGLSAFGVPIGPARALAATPVVQLVGSLPITPAGLGTQQAAMLQLFGGSLDGGPGGAGIVAFGLAFPLVLMALRCAIGLFYLRGLRSTAPADDGSTDPPLSARRVISTKGP